MTSGYLNFSGAPVRLSAPPNAWRQTTRRGQTLKGLVGQNNQLSDAYGGATLIGGGADDTFLVSFSATTIIEPAGSGVDTVMAWCNFTLPANVTDLELESANVTGKANGLGDLIVAAGAADTLVGGAGEDVLVDAGPGGDLFSLSRGGGKDVIYGFQAAGADHDAIQLTNFGLTSFSQVLADARQVGADVVLTLSATDQLRLRDIERSALTAADFYLQLNVQSLKVTFDQEFAGSLSIYNPSTGKGVWKTNFESGYQGAAGDQAYTSRTLTGNAEQEIYVDPAYQGTSATPLGLNPFSVSNGILTITASAAPSADLPALSGYKYTSGLLTTAKSFSQLYGYFEVRAALPVGKGAWPAFWLLPSNGSWPPELDALESIGGNTVYQTVHTDSTGSHTYVSAATLVNNVHGAYHDYGVLWTATTIDFYIDRVEVESIATPSDLHTPMYMLLNLAVGGTWPGDVPSNFTSAQMKIAYVRAYSLGNSPALSGGGAAGSDATASGSKKAAPTAYLTGAANLGGRKVNPASPLGKEASATQLQANASTGSYNQLGASRDTSGGNQAASVLLFGQHTASFRDGTSGIATTGLADDNASDNGALAASTHGTVRYVNSERRLAF